MPPPPQPALSGQPISVSTAGIGVPSIRSSKFIAPQPSTFNQSEAKADDDYDVDPSDKRQQKRAANRRSAQLSRKRKKQYIELLKEENEDLRRKEQILRAIPDLIVAFDSAGKMWFVSQSVSAFLQFHADELVGTSFWDRLCEDSVRLLKAAFMDSLAAQQPDSESTSLGNGVWELKLMDKDGSAKYVILTGVVHFAGDRPECVCSIRPREDLKTLRTEDGERPSGLVSNDSYSGVFSDSTARKTEATMVVMKSQSVSSSIQAARKPEQRSIRISDSGNSSVDSDGVSTDETNGESS